MYHVARFDLNIYLRVSRVGPEGPLNTFFLLIGIISQRLAMLRKEGNKHTWRVQYTGELYLVFGNDESPPLE